MIPKRIPFTFSPDQIRLVSLSWPTTIITMIYHLIHIEKGLDRWKPQFGLREVLNVERIVEEKEAYHSLIIDGTE
jgi:hypothetical protein